jgi:RNA polymerase sigma factor (sigma-70 family)
MDTEHEWTRGELRRAVERAVRRLTLRERQVMTLRFGLLDGQEHTLEEVGHLLQVTPERVRQLEERAWRKVRQDGPDGEAGTFVPVI